MLANCLKDVVPMFQRLEDLLETLATDGRFLAYARDLTSVVAWLRSQPRRRVLLWGALGAGAVVTLVLVGISGDPRETVPIVEEEWH